MAIYKELVTTDLAEKGLYIFTNGATKNNLAAIAKLVNEYFGKYYMDNLKSKVSAVTDEKKLEDMAKLI